MIQIYSKTSRERRWSGFLIGSGIGILLSVILFRHLLLAIFFTGLPILITVFLGLLSAHYFSKRRKGAPGIIVALFSFTVLIGFSTLVPKIREPIIQKKYELAAAKELPVFPESELISSMYFKGDGFNNESNYSVEYKASESSKTVRDFFVKELSQRGYKMEWELDNSLWFRKRTADDFFGIMLSLSGSTRFQGSYRLSFSIYR